MTRSNGGEKSVIRHILMQIQACPTFQNLRFRVNEPSCHCNVVVQLNCCKLCNVQYKIDDILYLSDDNVMKLCFMTVLIMCELTLMLTKLNNASSHALLFSIF